MLGQVKRKEIVKNIIENKKLIVKHGFDPIDISEGIDWNYQHSHNTRTYSVYLHAIEYVGYLVLAGKEYNDKNYYDVAKKIIISWEKQDSEESIEHSWNEHAVSYRLTNLILFQDTVSDDYKLENHFFDELLIKHCAFLADDNNYKPNNHGILMDESLFKASFYMTDEIYQKLYKSIALNRVKLALYRDFSRKGLHSENSPEYHRMMMIVLNRFNELINAKGETLTNDVNHKLKKAKKLLRIMLKPDSTYPMVGDTSYRVEKNLKKDFSDYIDYEGGLVIFQNENTENSILSDYLYFKCGYLSKTHKHFDDLSLNLMLEGNDIFVDAGKYGYSKKDPIRQYILSPEAHTVPLIEGKGYKPTSPIVDQYNLGITNATVTAEHKIVRGYNSLYKDIVLNRTAVLSEKGHFFLLDEIISEDIETLLQNFNINENANINIIDNYSAEIEINSEKYIIKAFFNESIELEMVPGYYSKVFSKYNENVHLRYKNQPGVKKSLITVYNINNPIEMVEVTPNIISYKHRDEIIKLKL